MRKHFWITAPRPYCSKILVVQNYTHEGLIRLLRHYNYSQSIAGDVKKVHFSKTIYAYVYFWSEVPKRKYLLIIHKHAKVNTLDSTVVHETNHLVYWMAHHHGHQSDMEAMAYLQEFLFEKIRKQLTR